MTLVSIIDYMKSLYFISQKPIKQAYQMNTDVASKWVEKEYPSIKKQAKKEKAKNNWFMKQNLL